MVFVFLFCVFFAFSEVFFFLSSQSFPLLNHDVVGLSSLSPSKESMAKLNPQMPTFKPTFKNGYGLSQKANTFTFFLGALWSSPNK